MKEQELEDLMVTVIEGGSTYWFDMRDNMINRIMEESQNLSLGEATARYLLSGQEVFIVDLEDESNLGSLTLENINKAMTSPNMPWQTLKEWHDGDWDAETTDVIIQIALFGEVVYG